MNAVTRLFPSPNSLIIQSVGYCTLGQYSVQPCDCLLDGLLTFAVIAVKCSLGVPYHSWRITHAKHHASTAHMTQDQVFVPKTRSELRLPAFNSKGEDFHGSNVSAEVRKELWEA